jgi:hypothetical protein
VLFQNEKVCWDKLKRKGLTDSNMDFGKKSSTPSCSFVSTNSFSLRFSFPLIFLFGLINKRDRANILLCGLFAVGELTLLCEKHLLGVFITGGDAFSFVGGETSLVGVAIKELMHCLTGVTS